MTVDDYLKARTGEGAQYWMDWIGNEIPKWTDKATNMTEPNDWIECLGDELWTKIEPMPRYNWKVMDENIICASLAGLILSLWAARVVRAKSHNPRRPLDVRQQMMTKLLEYQHMLFEAIIDESHDHSYFPAQEWESPFVSGVSNDEGSPVETITDENKQHPHTTHRLPGIGTISALWSGFH